MKRNGSRLGLVAGLVGLVACSSGGPPPAPEGGAAVAGELRVSGTVRKAPVGVNCWRLQGDDGNSYELLVNTVPSEVLVDGKQVTLELTPRDDMMSTCMVGRIVEVARVVSP
jgi:hypothetical protein